GEAGGGGRRGEGEVPADEIEQDRRQLREQVVQEFHRELQLIKPETDVEDQAEPVNDVGALEIGGVVDMDHGRPVDAFGDASGKLPRGQLSLAAEPQDGLAQRRDNRPLQGQDADGDPTPGDTLRHNERQGREGLAAKEGRLHEGIADEAAERLDLVLDHGGDFRLLHLAELRERKTQHAVEQLVAQAAQHALAHAALQRIYVELEGPVDEDENE